MLHAIHVYVNTKKEMSIFSLICTKKKRKKGGKIVIRFYRHEFCIISRKARPMRTAKTIMHATEIYTVKKDFLSMKYSYLADLLTIFLSKNDIFAQCCKVRKTETRIFELACNACNARTLYKVKTKRNLAKSGTKCPRRRS